MSNFISASSTQSVSLNNFFSGPLDPKNKYVMLAKEIDWDYITSALAPYYSHGIGRPALPCRLMVGLNIVKYINNLSDVAVLEAYKENPYIQYFCGATKFQQEAPCSDVALSQFRGRIGKEGCGEVFKLSILIHNLDGSVEVEVCILDTTAHEKNIAYPNDINLLVKCAKKCVSIARKYKIGLKNTHEKEIHECLKIIRFEKSSKDEKRKEVRKAKKRIYTIAGILYREIMRKMTPEQRVNEGSKLVVYEKVIKQSHINKTPSEVLKEKINDVVKQIEACKDLCSRCGIKIQDATNDRINNLVDTFKSTTGKCMYKTFKSILASLKRIADKLVKRIQQYLDQNNIVELSNELVIELIRIKDALISSIHDDRIYSIHEPQVSCITKGKAGVAHEYGSKASIAITKDSGIIVGACNFQGNPHDSNTVTGTVESVKDSTNVTPKDIYCDRGYRGAQAKNPEINIHIPSTPTSTMSKEEKDEARANFGRRASVEPCISHLKDDCRLRRNFLKGEIGDSINLLLSCAALNMRKWINQQAKKLEEEKKKAKKSK